MNMAETKLSMKLLIDKNGKRVLFAESGKDCVDFLFYILSLPISTLIRLLGQQQMVGSVANLYESIETLDGSYFQPNITKDTLLKPAATLPAGYSTPLLSLKYTPEAPTLKNFYICPNRNPQYSLSFNPPSMHKPSHYDCEYFSDDSRAICPSYGTAISKSMTYVAPPSQLVEKEEYSSSGFVKEVVTYMVMDDLVVKPMSTISSITLLTQFKIKDVCALEEKVVNLGMNEAVRLLKESLVSKKVLTSVFLNGDN